jgi:hypothetical protein
MGAVGLLTPGWAGARSSVAAAGCGKPGLVVAAVVAQGAGRARVVLLQATLAIFHDASPRRSSRCWR